MILTFYFKSDPTWLTTKWNLFRPITLNDVSTFFYWLSNIYVITAVSNYPFESNFMMPLPANPLGVSSVEKPIRELLFRIGI